METKEFDYELPETLIAQTPIEPRDHSRLLILNRSEGTLRHHRFFEIVDYLHPGDVLVFNNSRVIPARLTAVKAETGGRLEVLLLRRLSTNVWEALVRPGKRVRVGTRLGLVRNGTQEFHVSVEVVDLKDNGIRVLSFSDETLLPGLGSVPLPPYIHTPLNDTERYQTVYAREAGSVAAPTAGLHFTPELIERVKARGVHCVFTTLHIGLDTFLPVRESNPLEHRIHQEFGVLGKEAADELTLARKEGRRIICVGTTSVRLVESAAQASGPLEDIRPFEGWVSLFILPGYQFRTVDAMITNFHLPKSTLLMLVTAFTGKDLIMRAYSEAMAQNYRFYSFGDAMLII